MPEGNRTHYLQSEPYKPGDTNLKVQFLSRDLPIESTGGSSTYRLDFLRYLNMMGCNIEYSLFKHKLAPPNEDSNGSQSLADIANIVTLNSGEQAPVWNGLPTSKEKDFFLERFHNFKPDVIVMDRVWLGELFDLLPNESKTIKSILTHDVIYQRYDAFRAAGLEPFKKTGNLSHPVWDKDLESQQLRRSDIILAIQNEDKNNFTQMAPNSEVINMPMAASLQPLNPDLQVPGRVLFVGGSASHNVDGLQWFFEDVWDKVTDEVPKASLHVCGDIIKDFQGDYYTSTEFRGRVPDLSNEYSQAEVCIVPVRVGSGLKIKLVEALAHSRTAVSTEIGVQGVEDVIGNGVLLANSADDFAETVTNTLNNPVNRKINEIKGRQYAQTKLSPDISYGKFVQTIYERLTYNEEGSHNG